MEELIQDVISRKKKQQDYTLKTKIRGVRTTTLVKNQIKSNLFTKIQNST